MDGYWVVVFIWFAALAAFVFGAGWAGRHRPHKDWQHSFLTGMMSIFHEGEIARERDAGLEANPYVMGSPEWRSWSFGWAWVDERRGEKLPKPPGPRAA